MKSGWSWGRPVSLFQPLKNQINTLNETMLYMTNSNENKTISPEFKQLLHDIISDISALISEYLDLQPYDEDKIKAIVDGTFEPNTENTQG